MKIMNIRSSFLEAVGFETIGDFINTIFIKKAGVYLYAGILHGAFEFLDRFIENNVYSPSSGVYILFIITVLDILLGISKSVKNRNFDAYKLSRAWARFFVHIMIIGILYRMNQVWPSFIRAWMVDTIILSFSMATLWSVFKNAHELRWIQPSTYAMLERILSVEEVFKHFFNNKKNDTRDDKGDPGA